MNKRRRHKVKARRALGKRERDARSLAGTPEFNARVLQAMLTRVDDALARSEEIGEWRVVGPA